MTSLRELAIWGSDYKSALPPELGNLGNLTYLDCQNCSLWGSLPSELGKLKNLQRLYLNTNTFTGPIPQEWQDLTSLYILYDNPLFPLKTYLKTPQHFFPLVNSSFVNGVDEFLAFQHSTQ
jgi:Leucine-rich repeat (LRR) protein